MDPRLDHRPVGLSSAFSTILLTESVRAVLPVGAQTVIDVGGGESPYAPWAQGGHHVTVDRRRIGTTLASHQVIGDACGLPVRSGQADLVICTEVVEHVPDDGTLYAELRRVIGDEGTLVLTAPFVHGLHESPDDYRRPTSAGLLHALQQNGFVVSRMSAVGDTGDVIRDSLIRSLGVKVRAVARRVPPSVARAIERAFVLLQTRLADRAVGRTARLFHDIDPLQPVPRLSLGYVVIARPGEAVERPDPSRQG